MSDSELEPSRLGTKAHWDSVYEQEVANFEDTGDEGEIWFGEDSVEKMVDWALENISPASDLSILEVGSGNGTLLFALAEAGYNVSCLAGIDYSADAVKLAQMIASTRGGEKITFSQCDFLADLPAPPLAKTESVGSWDLLLDKGTYDAIALGEKDAEGRSPATPYPERAARLLKDGGFFLITSCNFTEEELKAAFATPLTGLKYHSRVKHPSISFGGKSGSVYATIAFQKSV
ncbi:S-adenosyl-L-methionine-dependent methyltransferase [Auriscalpium vulgare]|uniref:S-adenosyl-L-methionine-dependent methyltransferase n=1 Tax=Auriscalpium vulgare TaxID=40419 RepID=A0ACB8RK06_9AGAM|nr:S-adenosyl-L-methionine-dependent methyltransferase [Auriscalpium vulgare]